MEEYESKIGFHNNNEAINFLIFSITHLYNSTYFNLFYIYKGLFTLSHYTETSDAYR